MPEYPILYEPGGPEYIAALNTLKAALRVQARRNKHTTCLREGEPSPFSKAPPVPTKRQRSVLKKDALWKKALHGRGDQWWFDRVDAAVEENFYRSKVYCLIWWDRCEEEDLDTMAWHERMDYYDFDRDLECDWELVEYALHCAGYPPLKAHQMSFEAKDRRKWKEHRQLVFKCFECDAERTNLNYPPLRCIVCGKDGTMEQL